MIKHSRKLLILHNEKSWIKKEGIIYTTMGSIDGAIPCELIAIYLLHELRKIIDNNYTGLYRDEGLIIVSNYNRQNTKLGKQS